MVYDVMLSYQLKGLNRWGFFNFCEFRRSALRSNFVAKQCRTFFNLNSTVYQQGVPHQGTSNIETRVNECSSHAFWIRNFLPSWFYFKAFWGFFPSLNFSFLNSYLWQNISVKIFISHYTR